MACFLIDYENECVGLLECASLVGLTAEDEIIIFYSKNAYKISMELHKELEKIKAKKIYVKVETGTPNALDFQLSSYLVACIQKFPGKEYYIVSKDTGYDCVCNFWRIKNVCVHRLARLACYSDVRNDFFDL
ncbi:MAG: PIN domain-containing protein [Acetobacter sp.]|nr:PIN domain-containing protein [Bacteroides sp.]MCM1342163.1 PIN domain-containing protein [Acetobacter sp.]MCM1434370.1 PIN domain-containing protein [Clostridiales bacterium]